MSSEWERYETHLPATHMNGSPEGGGASAAYNVDIISRLLPAAMIHSFERIGYKPRYLPKCVEWEPQDGRVLEGYCTAAPVESPTCFRSLTCGPVTAVILPLALFHMIEHPRLLGQPSQPDEIAVFDH
jgi:hypothetical protein